MPRCLLALVVLWLTLAAAPAAHAQALAPPANLSATLESDTSVRLTWSPVAGAQSGYRVEYSTSPSGGTYTRVNSAISTTSDTWYVHGPVRAGTYWYRVCVVYTGGAACTQRAPSVTVPGDRTPPTATVAGITEGETVSGTVRVTGTGADDVRRSATTLSVDGDLLCSGHLTGICSFDLDTAALADGEHVLRAEARDWVGNTAVQEVRFHSSNPVSESLVAAYGFEDGPAIPTASDGSGQGRAGSILGATWIPAGRFGGALSFDRGGDRVDLPALGAFYQHGLTIEAWVKKASAETDAAVAGTWTSWTGGPMLWSDNFTGSWTATFGRGSATYLSSGQLPALGTWQHLAATFDRLTARFYLDGVEVASGAFTNLGNSNTWRIGSYAGSPGGFPGRIDEVRIYDSALAPAEIHTDMETPIPPL